MDAPRKTVSRVSPLRLGRVVATPGAVECLRTSGQLPGVYLERHACGDWGDVTADDARSNDEACRHEGDPERQERVLSAYTAGSGERLWIITEWDRSVTTILLPSEY